MVAATDHKPHLAGDRAEFAGPAAAPFWSNACSLNAWITSSAYFGVAANIAALRPCTEVSTIPARRSRTRSLAVRVMFTKQLCLNRFQRAHDLGEALGDADLVAFGSVIATWSSWLLCSSATAVVMSELRASLFAMLQSASLDSLQQVRGLKMWAKRSELFLLIDDPSPCVFNLTILPLDGRTIRIGHLETVWKVFGFAGPVVPGLCIDLH